VNWPPTSSQDVAEAREAQDVDEDDAQTALETERRLEAVAALLHARYCDSGWIGEDQLGRPQPCRACRPHLFADDHGDRRPTSPPGRGSDDG
jgi:hypothetical protein